MYNEGLSGRSEGSAVALKAQWSLNDRYRIGGRSIAERSPMMAQRRYKEGTEKAQRRLYGCPMVVRGSPFCDWLHREGSVKADRWLRSRSINAPIFQF